MILFLKKIGVIIISSTLNLVKFRQESMKFCEYNILNKTVRNTHTNAYWIFSLNLNSMQFKSKLQFKAINFKGATLSKYKCLLHIRSHGRINLKKIKSYAKDYHSTKVNPFWSSKLRPRIPISHNILIGHNKYFFQNIFYICTSFLTSFIR